MPKEAKKKTAKVEQVPALSNADVVLGEETWTPNPFVVVRGGLRVSDREYYTDNDPKAIEEVGFWQRVVNRFPDGTKVEVVPFDKKKHRVW
jgi:hypothetical protein